MLACIACSKHEQEDDGADGARAGTAPAGKEAVKSITSQIKDMVLKFSGSHRQGKGGSSSSFRSKSFRHQHHGSYTYEDAATYSQMRAASSSSMPSWDMRGVNEDSRSTSKRIPGVGGVGGGMVATTTAVEVVLEEDSEPKEWVAQVEPGVHITFVSLPSGAGNDLKRIRFSREMFNKWQAQRWWGENYDRIMELYNVQRYNRQALQTPARSEDGDQRESFWSRAGSARESPVALPISKDRLAGKDTHKPAPPPPPPPASTSSSGTGRGVQSPPPVPYSSDHLLPHRLPSCATSTVGAASFIKGEASSVDASRTTTSSRDEASVSISNASDLEISEWIEQDVPGVYLTIRELADGTRELRRVRFSREKFGEVHAKLWWEENRERIQAQYL